MQEGQGEDCRNPDFCIIHGAPDSGRVDMTHIDPSLHSQCQSQPNGRGVEDLGHVFQHHLKDEAEHRRHIAQRVHIKVPSK